MATKSIKKKRIICQKIGKIFSLFIRGISLAFFGMLFKMSVLPTKYMSILLAIYIPIYLILILFMLYKKLKLKIKIPCEVISFFLIILLGFGVFYMYQTMNFMGNIKTKKYQIENYYVVTLKDSDYESLKNLKQKKIGIYNSSLESQKEAISLLKKKLSFEEKNYKDIMKLKDDLLNKKIDAMYINGSYLSIIQDEDNKFESKTKIINTIEIKIENETVKKDINVTKEPFNIYISGIDVFGNISSVSRSDVNIVVTVNPTTHKILLTSIPRDYYVQLHGTTGYKDKLTHAGIYGVDMSISTIEDLLDIDINYYARVNFTTLIELVDAIGGIDVYSDYEFTSLHGHYLFKKGNEPYEWETSFRIYS